MKKYLKYFLITIFIFLLNITMVSAESTEIVKVELDNGSYYELKIIEIDKNSTADDDDIKVF